MVIFIDESGTHKKTGNSSVVVVYIEVRNLELFNKGLLQINESLGIKSFHWAEQRWTLRKRYLKRIINLDFVFKVAIFENPVNIDDALDRCFQNLVLEKNIRSVIIDGKKPKWYEKRIKKKLRDQGVAVKKLVTVRDELSEPGIQLADALAGFFVYISEDCSEKEVKILLNKFKKDGKLLLQMMF